MFRPISNGQGMLPETRGPFRGVLISLYNQTSLQEFQETYLKLTLEHPNYSHSEGDKHKVIIYYKYSYDAANILEAYGSDKNFHISLYNDKLSRTLHPEVLYIECTNTRHLHIILVNLGGDIINQTRKGTQVQFKSFKKASIAHEELRTQFNTKFAYKSEVPILPSMRNIEPEEISSTSSRDYHNPDQQELSIAMISSAALENVPELKELLCIFKKSSTLFRVTLRKILQETIRQERSQVSWENEAVPELSPEYLSTFHETSCQEKPTDLRVSSAKLRETR